MPYLSYLPQKNVAARKISLSNYKGVERTVLDQRKLECYGFTRVYYNS